MGCFHLFSKVLSLSWFITTNFFTKHPKLPSSQKTTGSWRLHLLRNLRLTHTLHKLVDACLAKGLDFPKVLWYCLKQKKGCRNSELFFLLKVTSALLLCWVTLVVISLCTAPRQSFQQWDSLRLTRKGWIPRIVVTLPVGFGATWSPVTSKITCFWVEMFNLHLRFYSVRVSWVGSSFKLMSLVHSLILENTVII